MKYIITGSCGMIGQYLKRELDKQGCECILEVDKRNSDISTDYLSVIDEQLNADIMFHLASNCKIKDTISNPDLAFENSDGIEHVLEYCRRNHIKKIVYFSSSRVLSEEENPYTASKKYGEHLCKAYHNCYGIDYIIIRPSTVYAPCKDITTRLLTTWVINALKGEYLVLCGDSHKTLDFTYISDFVDGIFCLLNNWEEAKNTDYDISGEDSRNLIDVAQLISHEIADQIGECHMDIELKEPEIAQPQQVNIDISKIKRFGYEPKIKLEEGIKRLVEFYLREEKK